MIRMLESSAVRLNLEVNFSISSLRHLRPCVWHFNNEQGIILLSLTTVLDAACKVESREWRCSRSGSLWAEATDLRWDSPEITACQGLQFPGSITRYTDWDKIGSLRLWRWKNWLKSEKNTQVNIKGFDAKSMNSEKYKIMVRTWPDDMFWFNFTIRKNTMCRTFFCI